MQEYDNDETRVKKRKTFGLISMIVGIPNLILAMITAFGGLGLTILMGFLAYAALTEDGGEDTLKALCLVFLVILFVALFILALITTVISILFALAIGGQTIGGYYAIKGINYGRSVVLIFLGSIAALLVGIGFILAGILSDQNTFGRVLIIGMGIFEMLSFSISLVSGIMIMSTRTTFIKKEDRLDSIKKRVSIGKKRRT